MDWKSALAGLKGTEAIELREDDCAEATPAAAPATPASEQRGKLTVQMERKGRGGKTATIVSGFTIDDGMVANVAAQLKKRLGTGGSARGGEILIQGDRRTDVIAALRELGFKA